MVNKCFQDGKFNEAIDVFNSSCCKEEGGFHRADLSGFNNKIATLSHLHMMAEAEHYYYQQLWNSFSSPDVHTYIPMIDAYISLDRVDNVLEKFTAMVNLKLATTPSCCCYTKECFGYLLDRGRALDCAPILSKMIRKGMEVDETTCNSVIRGLVNQGHFDTTIYDLLCDMKEFQCNITGMQSPPPSCNSDDSCSTTTAATSASDDLDTSVHLIPPTEGELERYALEVGSENDPESTIAALRPKFQLHHRVKTLIRAGDLDAAARESISVNSFPPFVDTCYEIIDAMYRSKRYKDATFLYDYFFDHDPDKFKLHYVQPDANSFNIDILSRCELASNYNEFSNIFRKCRHVQQDTSLVLSLDAYLRITRKSIELRMYHSTVEMLSVMMRKWGKKHPWVYNLVILGLLNIGALVKAKKMFHELKKWRCPDFAFTGAVDTTFLNSFPGVAPEIIVNSDAIKTMVNECFYAGKVDEAMDAFDSFAKGREFEVKKYNRMDLVRMDLAGFNNMIARLSELRMMDEAEHYYQQLWSSYEIPDVHTYIPLIDAYLDLLKIDNALDKLMAMVNLELVSDSIPTSCLFKWFKRLVVTYDRASDCAPILSKMLRKGLKVGATPCNIVIRDLVNEGRFHATLNLLCDMKEFEHDINWNDGCRPDCIFFKNR